MLYLVLLFTLLPSLAWAEPNLPTIVFTERLFLYSFVLIVSLEAWVIYKHLSSLTKKQSIVISLKANLLTMFFVIPLVWGIWFFIVSVLPRSFYNLFSDVIENNFIIDLLLAPWIGDEDNVLLAEWIMAPVYFIASYYAEYWFSRKSLKDYPQRQVKKAFFFANLYSYLMIMFFETVYQLGLGYYKELHPEKWYLW